MLDKSRFTWSWLRWRLALLPLMPNARLPNCLPNAVHKSVLRVIFLVDQDPGKDSGRTLAEQHPSLNTPRQMLLAKRMA